MKRIILNLIIISSLCVLKSNASTTIHVSGKYIIGICGDTIVLRGVNYAPFNWGWDFTDDRFAQIALSGANCVRIPWYSSSAAGGGAPLYDQLQYLDSAIAQCIRYKMIPIIELHDNTCDSSASALITLSNYYLQPSVLAIINNYKSSLIIDVANEALYHNWANNPAQYLTEYKATYDTIVSHMRNTGITVPIMIDAPDCGSDLTGLSTIAVALKNHDPLHNMIFSAHAYWYAYANNDSATERGILTAALAYNAPFVLGEVADLQDGNTNCQYTLNYQQLLEMCQELNMNWLCWSWDHDACSNRQITNAGLYNSLTAYGTDILNNPVYGISSHSIITSYLAHNESCITTGVSEINKNIGTVSLFPNPVNSVSTISVQSPIQGKVTVNIYNILGQNILTKESDSHTIYIGNTEFNSGIFFYRASIGNTFIADGKFVVE